MDLWRVITIVGKKGKEEAKASPGAATSPVFLSFFLFVLSLAPPFRVFFSFPRGLLKSLRDALRDGEEKRSRRMRHHLENQRSEMIIVVSLAQSLFFLLRPRPPEKKKTPTSDPGLPRLHLLHHLQRGAPHGGQAREDVHQRALEALPLGRGCTLHEERRPPLERGERYATPPPPTKRRSRQPLFSLSLSRTSLCKQSQYGRFKDMRTERQMESEMWAFYIFLFFSFHLGFFFSLFFFLAFSSFLLFFFLAFSSFLLSLSLLPPPVPRPVLHCPVQILQGEARNRVEQRDGGFAAAQLQGDLRQELVDGRRGERRFSSLARQRAELAGEDAGEGRAADLQVAEVDVPPLDVDVGGLACLCCCCYCGIRSEEKAGLRRAARGTRAKKNPKGKRRQKKPERKKKAKKISPIASASSS